jgi:hypothetical protein
MLWVSCVRAARCHTQSENGIVALQDLTLVVVQIVSQLVRDYALGELG